MKNHFELKMPSDGVNEGFARGVAAAFCLPLEPTLEQLSDVKTAISEAVTNAVVHAYDGVGEIRLFGELDEDAHTVRFVVEDDGKGIEDVQAALQPFYTTRPDDERSGMGFTIIETFMDDMRVTSSPGSGVRVEMMKVMK